MTKKILIDETVVKQALEALEDLQKYGVKQSRALFALRGALEVNNKGVNALAEQQAAVMAGEQTRPLGYLPKWAVDRLTGDQGKVADPLVWGLYTHVYLGQVDHGVAIYTHPRRLTQPTPSFE